MKKSFDKVILVALVTVALRVLPFLPLRVCVAFGGKLPNWMGVALGVALYIFGAIPMRFWGREKMRRIFYTRHTNHRRSNVYEKWLLAGLLRYLRGLLWGVPFIAGVVYFTVFREKLVYNTFWQPIRMLAILAGQAPNIDTGVIVALVLMGLFALLFAYGWWRDLPLEYLPVRSLGTKRSIHWARRIRKNHKGDMRKNALVNICLSLPAWIGFGAVLVPYVRSKVDFSLSLDMVLTQVLRLWRTALPQNTLIMLGGVALVLYVPFWLLRKTRNAALVGKMMETKSHSSRSHKSGSSSQMSRDEMNFIMGAHETTHIEFTASPGEKKEEKKPAEAARKEETGSDAHAAG